MKVSKKLWLSLFVLLDNANELEEQAPNTNDGTEYHYADTSDIVLWSCDGEYYIQDGDEFRSE